MKIFEEGRSSVLSGSALALAGLCGVMGALAVSDLATMLRLSSTSAFFLFFSRAVLPVNMPPLAAFAARHPVPLFLVAALFWLSGCVLALGVWRRAGWARRGAVAMLYLLSAAAALALLFPGMIVPAPLMYDGMSIAPEFNAAVKTAAFYLRVICLAGGGLCLWWALALDRGGLRKEFGDNP
ncbi:MAG: hypothetical protein A2234_06045 [Elusimicrobia bacterium RIFOXYA2_FULL_58_8]|nr:MAG: hypothetical protein A2285_04435 [Elusimicrobia bacterium RIFOXYA12_FULL_57_11]OGS17019.1 MAG: hypothetical protein A2234_06045 [Elusimicrobia bacterium RIFOXYA2_FULL_58_8]